MAKILPVISKVIREPLLHFLILASLLFGFDYLFSGSSKETILVDGQTSEYLIKQREDLTLTTLSPEEKEEVIASYVEEEILYREAYRRGLDKGDTRMRRNLILKMRGLLMADIPEPTEQQLLAYFEANPKQYTYSAKWALEQVFFPDQGQVPEGLVDQLNQGLSPDNLGEIRLGFGRKMPLKAKTELIGIFGSDAVRAILAITDDMWHGPIPSIHGVHFFRVVGQHPEYKAEYDQIKNYVKEDWFVTHSRRTADVEIERLKGNYDVVIEDWQKQDGVKP